MIWVILLAFVQIYGTSGGFIFLPQPATSFPEIIINRNNFRGYYPQSFSRMTLRELKCFQGGFFRAKIRFKSPLPALPTIENSFPGSNCLSLLGDLLKIDIPGEIFRECGVSPCGEDLCLRLRFPNVEGLRTASDGLLTLKCRSQESFMSQNHILRVSVEENLVRSASSVIEGGSQVALRSHLSLFRRSRDGSFTETLAEGGEVLLGEDLMLKAQMRAEDGWNFTGMSDISLARLSHAGEILNSAILVTQEGCVNPSMRSICPENPSFDPPLGHKFRFKAFSFPGMLPGEEIVLNVRLFGCLNPQDCLPNLTNCRSRSSRTKRSLASQSKVSRISFRISLGGESKDFLTPIFSISGLAIFCFGCLIVVSVLYRKKFQQIH